jgi:hypothetical protein
MRFNCTIDKNKWYRKFALLPHYCEDIKQCVWLEYYYRKIDWITSFGDVFYEYRKELPK